MDDRTILGRIHELIDEEHRLRDQVQSGQISPDEEGARLREVEASLDQCWDLLRRRRAARRLGEDPNGTQPRNKDQVERYLQ